MRNIVILASGPPKKDRERHTEINKNNGKIIIDDIIEKCRYKNTNLYIVVNKKNEKLINHLKLYHNNINILFPKDENIYSTFEMALSPKGDCILVVGDLINLQFGDIEKFLNTKLKCAICQYKIRWGKDIVGTKFIRRGDIGDCITLFSEIYKSDYLSENNVKKAEYYFNTFFPNKKINYKIYNDLGTFLNYSFFFNISSNPKNNIDSEKGTIYYNHKVYEDND